MRKIAIVAALAASLSGLSVGTSYAGPSRWAPLIEILPDLKDAIEAGVAISTNNVPGLFSDSTELPATVKRASSFHPGKVFETAPTVSGDQLWSPDPKVRTGTINEYDSFVRREAADIEAFRARRDAQAATMAEYERAYERLSNFANAAPDLIEKASKIPVVNETMPTEIATALLQAEEDKRYIDQIVREYRRIVGEYDAKLKAAEIVHEAHRSTLDTMRALQPAEPAPNKTGGDTGQPPPKTQDGASNSGKGKSYAGGIGAAVAGATAPVSGAAARQSEVIARNHTAIGPTPPPPTAPMPTVTVPTQQEPAWRGYITPYAP